ncbi:MAG: fasciclin domain-containing protein [Anaerolineae bacterium]|nr:fasciclin domain-containing protein [Anaerolineae bacterium]
MRKGIVLLGLLVVLALGIAPAFAQEMASTDTIADVVVASTGAETPEFTVLLAAVQAADPAFLETLSNADARVTVFAPTDAAFTELLAALNLSAEELLGNKALLDTVLSYHVVPGVFDAASVVKLDGAILGTALPENALAITLDGENVMVNDATVVAADVMAANGVVHVIDTVLLPADVTEIAAAMESAMESESMDAEPVTIAETVVSSAGASTPEFATLLAAVQAADPAVLTTLSGAGSYTVFAPTDAAFGEAFTALNVTPEDVLADQANLTNILLYHVIPGSFSAETVIAAASASEEGVKVATLLPGTTLTIKVVDGSVMVNEGTVATPDVAASNGIIHVIDGVLLPPSDM